MKEDIDKAIEVLNSGGVILYPTDTIWGIGCDATNEEAVKKVYSIKKREDTKSMLVLLSSLEQLNNYVDEVPKKILDLLKNSEKPTTVIYPGAKEMAPNLISSDGTIGIRIPLHEFCQNLLSQFAKPLVSTSANISGSQHALSFQTIDKEVVNSVDYIVQWEQDKKSNISPSSIIKVNEDGEILTIRK